MSPSNSDTIEAPALTADSILEALNDETDDVIPETTEESSPKDDLLADKSTKTDKDDDSEDKEKIELSEDEDDEEPDTELRTPVRRKEILAKYPTLFKDFPYLESAYYREQQFTELLPTIDDAKEAVEKSQALDKFEGDLFKGSPESILKSVKENNQAAFEKIVDNYLPALRQVDERAFNHVIMDTLKSTIVAMITEARDSSNQDLQNAALILNQFVTGSSKFVAQGRYSKGSEKADESPENDLNKERQEFLQEKFESAKDELDTRTTNVIKSTISQHIDPKGAMSDYVRKTAVKDAIERTEEALRNDSRFRVTMNKLWEKSYKENFSKSSLDAIKSAYLSRAKSVLPAVIQKSRNDALKGMGKRVTSEKDTVDRKPMVSSGRAASSTNSKDAQDKPKRGESTYDFLNRD